MTFKSLPDSLKNNILLGEKRNSDKMNGKLTLKKLKILPEFQKLCNATQSTQPSLLFIGRNTVQDTAFPATSIYLLSTKSYTGQVGIKYGLQHQYHSATSEK